MRTLLLSIVVISAACKSGEADKAAPTSESKADASAPAITDAYLSIGEKLAADSTDGVEGLAKSVSSGAQTAKSDPGMAGVLEGAGKLPGAELDAARAAFQTLSNGFIQYLVANPGSQEGLQLVHCPMAFGGKGGYWVQKPGKVVNPYEGSRMLHCGEVTKWEDAPKS